MDNKIVLSKNGLTQEQIEAFKFALKEIENIMTQKDFLTTEKAMPYVQIIDNVASMLDIYKRQLSTWEECRYSIMKTRKIDTIALITTL
tara:strand:+ start:698 stop:964 length:267 start_codon:yes stop_codon:yes gene_type:complete